MRYINRIGAGGVTQICDPGVGLFMNFMRNLDADKRLSERPIPAFEMAFARAVANSNRIENMRGQSSNASSAQRIPGYAPVEVIRL
jgi:hypothetical protein